MKNGANELMRIQNVLEEDRLNVGKGFEEVLISDLNKLLKDYFDFNSLPSIKLIKNKGKYCVNINVDITRVRALNYVLEEDK